MKKFYHILVFHDVERYPPHDMFLDQHRADWEVLGELDPCYAVLSHSEKKFCKWDEKEFFLTGEKEIEWLCTRAKELGYPKIWEYALDFGCGVGRLARALSRRFGKVIGVDIASSMIEKAKVMNEAFPTCEFRVNTSLDLALFADESFDLVYSSIVLQHVPSAATVKSYLVEFVRILKPGGLIAFQLPAHITWQYRFQPFRHLYQFLRRLGISEKTLYKKWHLVPIRMGSIPRKEVIDALTKAGANILSIDRDAHSGPHVESWVYFVSKTIDNLQM